MTSEFYTNPGSGYITCSADGVSYLESVLPTFQKRFTYGCRDNSWFRAIGDAHAVFYNDVAQSLAQAGSGKPTRIFTQEFNKNGSPIIEEIKEKVKNSKSGASYISLATVSVLATLSLSLF